MDPTLLGLVAAIGGVIVSALGFFWAVFVERASLRKLERIVAIERDMIDEEGKSMLLLIERDLTKRVWSDHTGDTTRRRVLYTGIGAVLSFMVGVIVIGIVFEGIPKGADGLPLVARFEWDVLFVALTVAGMGGWALILFSIILWRFVVRRRRLLGRP